MRRMFTAEQAARNGLTRAALRWGEQRGRWTKVDRGVYAEGPEEPTEFERAVAAVMATKGVASGSLAGVLLGFDGVAFKGPDLTLPPGGNGRRAGVRRRVLPPDRITVAHGIACTNGLQTLVDLAPSVTDETWEQALEAALRKRLTTLTDVQGAARRRSRCPGAARMQRVLALRPPGAPPTESLLETLMVQLARRVPGLGEPVRQFVVRDAAGRFVARVDLAWPEIGLFLELDGRHHKDQPVYDANRETAIVAATGWLCGRFTWDEVVNYPGLTARRLTAIVVQARRRTA